MGQRNSAKTARKSDLQPVYDVIDALQPNHVRAVYKRLDRRTRAILLISIASVVLLWAGTSMIQLAFQYIRSTSGPFLTDALKAPYDLEARLMPMPPSDQSAILPNALGDYGLVGNLFQATPIPARDGAGIAQIAPVSIVNTELGLCLNSALEGSVPTNCTGYNALFAAAGDYLNSAGAASNITLALFSSHSEAGQVMRKLHQQASITGVVGNFAIGVRQVDYFYSSKSDLYSFTWANGSWVYTASSQSFDDLEKFVTQLPY